VIIHAYNEHVRLLPPEPAVVDKPQSTRVKEPTLLCNQVGTGTTLYQPGPRLVLFEADRFSFSRLLL
jgi:hypothetical protein